MSTFIEIYPVESHTKRTTIIRLDDDFKLSIREERAGTDQSVPLVRDIRQNYSGLEEGQEVTGTDPVRFVRVSKLGRDARCVITVNTYYLRDEESTIPRAGLYWYNTGTHYDPESIFFTAKGETTTNRRAAPNSDFTKNTDRMQQSQQFDYTKVNSVSTIFNISRAAGFPITANSVPVSFTLPNVYTQLGTGLSSDNATKNRRNYLKGKLQTILEHPDRIIRLMNAAENIDTTISLENTNQKILTAIGNSIARPRSFVIWLEMWANIISNSANYDSLQKFNLMNGELGLSLYDLVEKPTNPAYGTGQIQAGTTVRSNWSIHVFGTLGAAPDYEYMPPTATTWDESSTNASILAMPSTTVGRNWEDYIRSREEISRT